MAELVTDPRDERRLRADHDEVDSEATGSGEVEQALGIVRTNGVAVAVAGNPGVARRGVELDPVTPAQLPCEGVLTPSRTDEEDLHRATLLAAPAGLKARRGEHTARMSMNEPGLSRHEWETQLAALDDDLHDDPFAALPELADLVERMLTETGYDISDPVARDGEEREVVVEYLAAREVSDLVEAVNGEVSPGDVAAAIEGLRSVADYLLAERVAL
jgi:hypothetical protein